MSPRGRLWHLPAAAVGSVWEHAFGCGPQADLRRIVEWGILSKMILGWLYSGGIIIYYLRKQ